MYRPKRLTRNLAVCIHSSVSVCSEVLRNIYLDIESVLNTFRGTSEHAAKTSEHIRRPVRHRKCPKHLHLVTLIRGHLAVLGVKWPFFNGRDRR